MATDVLAFERHRQSEARAAKAWTAANDLRGDPRDVARVQDRLAHRLHRIHRNYDLVVRPHAVEYLYSVSLDRVFARSS
jgi:hypothetical protein